MKSFYSHGKLLITGEYAVLDGAKALAVPTKFGQDLQVETIPDPIIKWKSFDEKGNLWLETEFTLENGEIFLSEKDRKNEIARRLLKILKAAATLKPEVFSPQGGYRIKTHLEFNKNWGLGSSSTLINNLASWLEFDAYNLLKLTFGGSGYDIAAAQRDSAFSFQLSGEKPVVFNCSFDPVFKDQLFFVHLNQKKNSRQAIAHYRNQPKENLKDLIDKISGLTEQIIICESLKEFRLLIDLHETLIAKALNLPKIKTSLFPDYPGSIKSLGGWGGDFVLATGGKAEMAYFREKNHPTIIPYSKMVL